MKKYIIKILNFLGKHLFAHALKDDSIERFTNYSLERSTKTFWVKKGHLLCSTCLDSIDKKKS